MEGTKLYSNPVEADLRSFHEGKGRQASHEILDTDTMASAIC
jgi:hypothetical protein